MDVKSIIKGCIMGIIKKILEQRAPENLIELDESAEAALAKKSKESGVSLSVLKTVYRRGVAAWNSGHRPGTTPQQWGMARVNSYITKGKGTYHGADKDLREDLDEDSRIENKKYHKGVSDSTAKARVAHWKKMDKLSDRDPRAYEPAPGDATAKTKESKYTKKYRELYGEEAVFLEDLDEQIEMLDEMPGANMDTRAVHQHLKKAGWALSRTSGGHDIYTHPEAKHSIPVPRHRQLKAPLVLGILKSSKLRKEEKETEELDTSDYKLGKDGRKVRAHKIVFNKGEEEMKEELKGKQHKLDVDKDGKIEGEDLAKLRKMKKEETELDERELSDAEMKERERIVKGMKKSFKDFKGQYGSRAKSVMYATATKLAKEEFSEDILEELEQIEELSRGTLASYVSKAARSYGTKRDLATTFQKDADTSRNKDKKAARERIAAEFSKEGQKRRQGIDKAASRLAKEEVEQIEEASNYKKVAVKSLEDFKKHAKEHGYHLQKVSDNHHQAWREGPHGGAHLTGVHLTGSKYPDETWMRIPKKVAESVELDEEIKPYVSGGHADGWSILDHAGKEVKKFHWKDYKDHPVANKQKAAKDDAMAYLKKHYNSLRKPTNECVEEVLLDLCEAMIERDDFDDRVSAYKKAGYKVLDTKHSDSKAHISFVDSEGTHRTVKYSPTGKTMQNHGQYAGGGKDESGEKVNKSEVKTVKRGRGRPRKDKFAESVDILLSLTEEEFDEIMEGSSLDEIVESLCNLSEEELKELKGE
jgi:predicted RNA binding protein YcfA (HicA-like mRNA interferase family)